MINLDKYEKSECGDGYILSHNDNDHSATGAWLETYIIYYPDDDESYRLVIDQDGGENFEFICKGLEL